MKVGTVAEILEDMLGIGKRCLTDPGHALAAHVREGSGGTIHPLRHVMAADAGQRARTFRYFGR